MFTLLTLGKGTQQETTVMCIGDTLEGAIQEARNFAEMNGYAHFTVENNNGFVSCYGND